MVEWELQLDGSLLRLSQNTACSFLNLSDNATQVQLTAGTLLVRVRRLDENETYEIATPYLAFSVLRPGLYRFAVNENGDGTMVNARKCGHVHRANESDIFELRCPGCQSGAPVFLSKLVDATLRPSARGLG